MNGMADANFGNRNSWKPYPEGRRLLLAITAQQNFLVLQCKRNSKKNVKKCIFGALSITRLFPLKNRFLLGIIIYK